MANIYDDNSFDEAKARELIYFLLNNDTISFKRLIPEIKELDSESFENLFQGIPFKNNDDDKDGYIYHVKNKKMFKKLLDKFDNFYVILDAWYKDKKYYEYLKELWVRYISIQNLKGKEDKELETFLKSNKIDYANWPEYIKDELKVLISSTEDTRIMELKNIIDNQFSEFNCIIEKLNSFKETIKDIPDIKNYEINAQNMIMKILGTVMLPIAICSSKGMTAIDCKQIKSVQKLIYNNTYLEFPDAQDLTESLLNKIKGQKGSKIFQCRPQDPADIIEEVRVKCTDGKIDNLNISQKLKAFLKSKWVCGLHAILSFLNLGYSVYEITQTYKGFEDLKNYNKRLNEIRTSFNIHKKEIGILPDDFEESTKKINEVYNKIREDQIKLQNLMIDIMKSIQFQESQKTKAKASLATSIVLGTVGVVGGVLTCNGTSILYGISSVANVISACTNGANICMSNTIVKGLNEVLKKAIDLNKEIQDEIDNLIKELNRRMAEQPKFDLSESFSSISTNV